VAVAIGKWFTPGLGLRTKLQGVWGKTVTDDTNAGNGNKYWILNEHILFNVSNMLYGYNPNRVWNFIPFAGGGIGRTCSYNLYSMDLSAGILNEFNVSRHVAVNLEFGWNRLETDIDGIEGSPANRGWDSHDNNFYGEVGLTFNLGKATWNKVPDVDAIKALSQSQIDALNAQLADANAENARLKNLLANQKPAEAPAVKEFVTTPVSVFFNINKTNIASQKDLVNVEALAKYAKDNNSNILVKGYADSATGTPAINQKLSEGRANTLANELVKKGINRDNIKTEAKGGVDDLSPISFNRRATAEITE
jgi:outer membrane protein OmpA-like peptidoglycan-associated protein